MKSKKQFYKEGLRFTCQGDGKCCLTRGKYGYVYLSFSDRKRLAKHFYMTTTEFTAAYTKKTDGLYELVYTREDCPFLKENRCSVYPARPWQCRTWPFWPENMNEKTWEQEVLRDCPGAGKGRLYSREEIKEILLKKREV
ncbi:MAG: YkgJ family cysteine cluster protein [Nitrospirota bacterium]